MLRKLCRIGGTALFVALILFGRNLAGYLVTEPRTVSEPSAIAEDVQPDPMAMANSAP